MWASFTRTEKWILLWLLALFGAGKAVLPLVGAGERSEVFPAGAASGRSTAAIPGGTSAAFTAVVQAQTGGGAGARLPGVAEDGRIDLNTAPAEVLDTLPGIGASRTQAILRLRAERGGFRSVEELDDVAGIGPAAMGKLRPLVTVEAPPSRASPAANAGAGSPAPPMPSPAAGTVPVMAASAATPPPYRSALSAATPSAPRRSSAPPAATGPVNINTASEAQLETLKYIGPKLAERIVLHRRQFGPFRSPQELEKVKGIGRRILAENYGRITVR